MSSNGLFTRFVVRLGLVCLRIFVFCGLWLDLDDEVLS